MHGQTSAGDLSIVKIRILADTAEISFSTVRATSILGQRLLYKMANV